MRIFFFITIVFFCSEVFSANISDSTQSATDFSFVRYFQKYYFSPKNQHYRTIDSSLNRIQNYFPGNFSSQISLPSRKLFFESATKIGFCGGFDDLDFFGYNSDSIKYFNTRVPYTELFALFGSKKEQFLKLAHTQNVKKNWNIAVNMLRIRSEGFYQRQIYTDNNFSISTNYKSKKNRYNLLANVIFSSVKFDENGGIADDLDFEEGGLLTKQQIPVKLNNAKSKRGHRSVYINQFVNFGKIVSAGKNDSLLSSRVIPKSSLSLATSVKDSWFVYEDNFPKSGFYKNVIHDSVKTLDSTWVLNVENKILWNYFANKWTSDIFYLHSFNSVYNKLENDSVLMNHIAGFSFRNNYWKNKFQWKYYFSGEYIIDGANKNDAFLFSEIIKQLSINSSVSLSINTSQKSPAYIFTKYSSNHFQWINTFGKISASNATLKFSNLKYQFQVGTSYTNVFNYVFFDSTFLPAQFNDDVTIISAFADKNFHLNKFNFYNKIVFQQSSENIIRLPEFVTQHSFYYEDKWFKRAMEVQIGLDIRFNTEYFADDYMPALGKSYSQNEKKIGNYPFADFFFNMKVKRARIFFKSEHFLSGLLGNTYYLAPHYPAPDRSFKIGVSWIFFD